MFTEKDAKDAIIKIAELKGLERAREIEAMFRLETRHFKSKQFQVCGSPGMEYGKWANLDEDKMDKIIMNDNHLTGDKKSRTFIAWKSVFDFCLYLSDYIDRHDGNIGRWNSTKPEKQLKYKEAIKKMTTRFV